MLPNDFSQHADRVDNDYSDEMSRRASITMRYYYIFHRMREENDNHPRSNFTYRTGDHGECSSFLYRLGYNDLADDFDDLRAKRNKANYDISDSIGNFEYQMFQADLEDFELEAQSNGILR